MLAQYGRVFACLGLNEGNRTRWLANGQTDDSHVGCRLVFIVGSKPRQKYGWGKIIAVSQGKVSGRPRGMRNGSNKRFDTRTPDRQNEADEKLRWPEAATRYLPDLNLTTGANKSPKSIR